jgi:hypothetical protein
MNDIEFMGEVVSANTNGEEVLEGNEKYVKIVVVFSVVKSSMLKVGDRIEVEYHIMRTTPDIESVQSDKNSLLNWTFHEGNVIKVQAKRSGKIYIDCIYSIQELNIEWADSVGQGSARVL